jgi:triosephosphate isomerase
MIFVNFKTYQEGTAEKALKLVQVLEQISLETSIKIIPVLQATDLLEVSQSSKLELWVQHIDPIDFGAHTGAVLAEAVLEDGASGTFLNHSEKKFANFADLDKAVKKSQSIGLKTLVFAATLEELKSIIALKPTYLAYEPPELVGNVETSVSKVHPDIILKASEAAHAASLPLIVGAGVHSQEDVRVSLQLGATGIAVATNILKAEDPRAAVLNLVKAFEG